MIRSIVSDPLIRAPGKISLFGQVSIQRNVDVHLLAEAVLQTKYVTSSMKVGRGYFDYVRCLADNSTVNINRCPNRVAGDRKKGFGAKSKTWRKEK